MWVDVSSRRGGDSRGSYDESVWEEWVESPRAPPPRQYQAPRPQPQVTTAAAAPAQATTATGTTSGPMDISLATDRRRVSPVVESEGIRESSRVGARIAPEGNPRQWIRTCSTVS